MPPSRLAAVVCLASLTACGARCGRDPLDRAALASSVRPAAAATASPAVSGEPSADRDGPAGIVVERIETDAPSAHGDGAISPLRSRGGFTAVRIDPARYEPRLYTAARHGRARTAPHWADDFGLVAVVNASMYDERGQSVSLLVEDGVARTERDAERFGGVLAFAPTDPSDPPVLAAGRGCDGFDLAGVRRRYRDVVANYRLLDCAGGPVAWKDEKVYSAAAIAVDARGWIVLLHSRAPQRMSDFARRLAASGLHLVAAHYVEGGPEASLFVRAGTVAVEAIGSYETGFRENDDNASFWELPNVLGFAARAAR